MKVTTLSVEHIEWADRSCPLTHEAWKPQMRRVTIQSSQRHIYLILDADVVPQASHLSYRCQIDCSQVWSDTPSFGAARRLWLAGDGMELS